MNSGRFWWNLHTGCSNCFNWHMADASPVKLPSDYCHWLVNFGSDNGLVPSDNKPLTETMLTQLYCHMVSLGHKELKLFAKMISTHRLVRASGPIQCALNLSRILQYDSVHTYILIQCIPRLHSWRNHLVHYSFGLRNPPTTMNITPHISISPGY